MIKLVLVHGCQHKASYWLGMQRELSPEFESMAVELAGGRFWTIAHYVSELRSQIAHLDQDHIVFVGHSLGALIIQSHLATGGRALGQVLMAPVPLDFLLLWRHAFRLALQTHISNAALSALTLNSKHVMAPDVETMQTNFFLPTTTRTTRIAEGGHTLEEYFATQITDLDSAAAALWTCPGNARDIKFPTLILAAAHDRLIRLETIQALANILTNLTDFKIIQGQAHAFADPGWEISVTQPIREFALSFVS